MTTNLTRFGSIVVSLFLLNIKETIRKLNVNTIFEKIS